MGASSNYTSKLKFNIDDLMSSLTKCKTQAAQVDDVLSSIGKRGNLNKFIEQFVAMDDAVKALAKNLNTVKSNLGDSLQGGYMSSFDDMIKKMSELSELSKNVFSGIANIDLKDKGATKQLTQYADQLNALFKNIGIDKQIDLDLLNTKSINDQFDMVVDAAKSLNGKLQVVLGDIDLSGLTKGFEDAGNGAVKAIKNTTNKTIDILEKSKKDLIKASKAYYSAMMNAYDNGVDISSGETSKEMDRIQDEFNDVLNSLKLDDDTRLNFQDVLQDILYGDLDVDDIEKALNKLFKNVKIDPINAIGSAIEDSLVSDASVARASASLGKIKTDLEQVHELALRANNELAFTVSAHGVDYVVESAESIVNVSEEAAAAVKSINDAIVVSAHTHPSGKPMFSASDIWSAINKKRSGYTMSKSELTMGKDLASVLNLDGVSNEVVDQIAKKLGERTGNDPISPKLFAELQNVLESAGFGDALKQISITDGMGALAEHIANITEKARDAHTPLEHLQSIIKYFSGDALNANNINLFDNYWDEFKQETKSAEEVFDAVMAKLNVKTASGSLLQIGGKEYQSLSVASKNVSVGDNDVYGNGFGDGYSAANKDNDVLSAAIATLNDEVEELKQNNEALQEQLLHSTSVHDAALAISNLQTLLDESQVKIRELKDEYQRSLGENDALRSEAQSLGARLFEEELRVESLTAALAELEQQQKAAAEVPTYHEAASGQLSLLPIIEKEISAKQELEQQNRELAESQQALSRLQQLDGQISMFDDKAVDAKHEEAAITAVEAEAKKQQVSEELREALRLEKEIVEQLNQVFGVEHAEALAKAVASEDEKKTHSEALTTQLAQELDTVRKLVKAWQQYNQNANTGNGTNPPAPTPPPAGSPSTQRIVELTGANLPILNGENGREYLEQAVNKFADDVKKHFNNADKVRIEDIVTDDNGKIVSAMAKVQYASKELGTTVTQSFDIANDASGSLVAQLTNVSSTMGSVKDMTDSVRKSESVFGALQEQTKGLSGVDLQPLESALKSLKANANEDTLKKFNTELVITRQNIAKLKAAQKNDVRNAGRNSVNNADDLIGQVSRYVNDKGTGATVDQTMFAKSIKHLQKVRNDLENALATGFQQANNMSDDQYKQYLDGLVQQTKNAAKKVQEQFKHAMKIDMSNVEIGTIDVSDVSQIQQQLEGVAQSFVSTQDMYKDRTIENQRFNDATKELTFSVRDQSGALHTYVIAANEAGGAVKALRHNIKQTDKDLDKVTPAWKTFAKTLFTSSRQLVDAFVGGIGIQELGQQVRKGLQYVRDLDLALTELRKVTDETDATYEKFLDTASETAGKIGTTITDFTNATADFARLGYSITEASSLAEAASVYKNVGDGIDTIEQATESIISTMKAFGIEAEDAMDIVNRFNEVGNNFAISSTGIGDALQRSASALYESGNTIDESIALITAANSVVQNPEQVGTALKTLSLRLRGAKVELAEAGLETENMAESTATLQKKLLALTGGKVDIMADADTFKNTTQILREMADAWSDMTDIERAERCPYVQKCA